MTVTIDLGPGAPQLSCPKCGHAETGMSYCDGCDLRPSVGFGSKHADDVCDHGDVEHFHRSCARCRYRWRTNDVINPRKVCEQ